MFYHCYDKWLQFSPTVLHWIDVIIKYFMIEVCANENYFVRKVKWIKKRNMEKSAICHVTGLTECKMDVCIYVCMHRWSLFLLTQGPTKVRIPLHTNAIKKNNFLKIILNFNSLILFCNTSLKWGFSLSLYRTFKEDRFTYICMYIHLEQFL